MSLEAWLLLLWWPATVADPPLMKSIRMLIDQGRSEGINSCKHTSEAPAFRARRLDFGTTAGLRG